MSKEKNLIINEVAKIISKDFTKDGTDSFIPFYETQSFDEFKKFLREKLAYLIDNNFDLLVNILYRIDVNEEKLSYLFSSDNREHIPSKLADLIIERQIQKIELRNKYKNSDYQEIQ